MLSREEFITQFEENSLNGKFIKENQPDCGVILDDAFISNEVEEYKKVLRSLNDYPILGGHLTKKGT